MKLAGVLILYYPDNEVVQNIHSYIHILDKLYIIDNSEKSNPDFVSKLVSLTKTVYLHNGINTGLAARLNQAASLSIDEGYDFLLTMDQDSRFDLNNAMKYKTCIKESNLENTAIAGVEYLNKTDDADTCKFENVSELITSGSVLNLAAWKKLQGFDENLFIDFVDHEFCYRAILQGFQIIKFNNIFLMHAVGKSYKARSVKSFKITERTFHSPLRIYYMVRNYLYIREKYYPYFKPALIKQRNSILTRIKNNFLYDKERINLCKYIYKALVDYRTKRMGKIKN